MEKKRGPGRPKGTTKPPEELKQKFSTKLSPKWITFLDEMKERGHSKAWVIDKGLELVKTHMKKKYGY
jgi:hypothetical protein